MTFLAVVLTTGLANGQEFTLEVDVPAVSFNVSVVDGRGMPVEGLTRSDFEVRENGILQPTRYFSEGTVPIPHYVRLLFDTSGSTANRWDLMETAIAEFAAAARPGARLSAGIFGSSLHMLNDWESPERQGVLPRLSPSNFRLESGRSTQFYRTLAEALGDGLFHGIEERRILVVMTDGRDSSLYRETLRKGRVPQPREDFWYVKLMEALGRSGSVPVYFIAVNTDVNVGFNRQGTDEYQELRRLFPGSSVPDDYLRQVRHRMEEIARVSGGQVLFPEGIEDVARFAKDITRGLEAGYSVGYSPAPAEPGQSVRTIAVAVTGRDDLHVRTSQTEYDPR